MMDNKNKIIYNIVVNTLLENEVARFNKLYHHFFTFLDKNFRNSIAEGANAKWQKWLMEIDAVNGANDIVALKVVTAILYQENDPYGRDITDVLVERFKRYFHNEAIDRREKINFSVAYHSSKPKEYIRQYSDYRFTEALGVLFVEEAKEDLHYILEQFDKFGEPDRNYFFNFLDHDVEMFLEFGKVIKEYRPLLYMKTLYNFLRYYNKDWIEYKDIELNEKKIREVSSKLYIIIDEDKYTTEFKVENVLQKMIHYCYNDEEWYENLFIKLWDIESAKDDMDKNSLDNYFLIVLNSKNESLVEEIEKAFFVWSESYRSFDIEDENVFIKYIKEIDSAVEKTFKDVFGYYRNIHSSINDSKSIINDKFSLYWKILTWLKDRNKKLYFIVLVQYLRVNYYSDKVIIQREEIGKKAKDIFMNEFEDFAKKDMENATSVVGLLLQKSSRHRDESKLINEVLNKIYFILLDLDQVSAENELYKVQEEEKEYYAHYDRGGPSYWNPKYASTTKYLTVEVLERLSLFPDVEIRQNVAENKKTPVKILKTMSKDRNEYVRAKVALNFGTPLETLKQMINNEEEHIVSSVCRNPNIDEDFLYDMCRKGSPNRRLNIAMNPDIPQKCIEFLSDDIDKSVRSKISEHIKTSSDILRKLSEDKEPSIRKIIAKNPNTPNDILDVLSRSFISMFSQEILNLKVDNLKKKFKSKICTVKYKLTGDYIAYQRRYQFVIRMQTKDIIGEYRDIRLNVANNKNTSLMTLQRLVKDKDKFVSDMAKQALESREKEKKDEK